MPTSADPGPAAPVEPLGVVPVAGGTIYPVHPSPAPHRMHYGVLRADGTLVESTVQDRHHGEHTFIPPDPSRFDTVDAVHREMIYAGPLYAVYGHFLIESCSRLWWAADHPDLPIVWTADEHTPPELNRWQLDILEILGIRNEVVILTRPTCCDLLQVPDAGYTYADWVHPRQVEFLAAYEGPDEQPGVRLWLSRDPAHGRGLINRHIIERRLTALGWTVATFELMPVRAQLDALARAEVVAGEEASTFHNLLLLDDVGGKRFHVFRRHGPEHLSFRTIGEARDVDQQFHSCSQDALISVAGRAVVRLAPNPAQYLSHLGVPIAPRLTGPSDRGVRPAIQRLNRLATITGAKTYLQLGWLDPDAFTQVEVEHRDIVDDDFTFDVRSYRGEGASFYEVTLEQYLTWFSPGRTHDLVVLDHQQDWRDALEKIRTVFASAAHDRTVLVLNHGGLSQTNPDRTDPEQTDLFRTVLALRELHPELEVRTVVQGGDAQTVIWQHGQPVRRRSTGHIVSEERAWADLRAWLTPRPAGRVRRLLSRARRRLG